MQPYHVFAYANSSSTVGSKFQSPEAIAPYLEYAGSGITSLWARTIALKYNCVVVAGYAEKANDRRSQPASLMYYNSALVVNADGETLANYRKTFLDSHDESWASKGPTFFRNRVEELGNVAIAIGTDINPYQNKAPWMAWEFAYHALHKQSNLIILSTAWLTPDDLSVYSAYEGEPDMNTLAYWISRLEPIIRAEDEGEVIVVIANRCGAESDALYAGTSCVLGVQNGEVKVYGLLGRGDRNLLLVDTSKPPLYNLVTRANAQVQQRTVTSRISEVSERNRPSNKEDAYSDAVLEGQSHITSIDSILAANVGSRGQVSDGEPDRKQEEQLHVDSRNVSSQSPVLDQERPLKRAEILPSEDTGAQERGLSGETQWKPTSSTNVDKALDHSVPDTSEEKSSLKLSKVTGSPKIPPINTKQPFCLPKSSSPRGSGSRSHLPLDSTFPIGSGGVSNSSYFIDSAYPRYSAYPPDSAYPDSAYPRYSAYPPDSAYPDSAYPPYFAYPPDSACRPDSAYPPDSACRPKSAYPPKSATSTTLNVPWDRNSSRTYYGDKELMRFIRGVPVSTRKTRPDFIDNVHTTAQPTDDEPRSAFSPNLAYDPPSACSMTVNVPWEPRSALTGDEERRGKKNSKAPDRRRATDNDYYVKCSKRSLAIKIPNTREPTYNFESSHPGSEYTIGSGVSMIVNVPWEPQKERRFYGDQELLSVTGSSAALRMHNAVRESASVTKPTKSLMASPPGLGTSTVSKRTYTGQGGNRPTVDNPPSMQEVTVQEDQSTQLAVLAQDLASPSQNSTPPIGIKEIATGPSPQQTHVVYSGSAASPVKSHSTPNVATQCTSASNEPTVSKVLEVAEPMASLAETIDRESGLSRQVSTTINSSSGSGNSVAFEMPLVASNDLFPCEGFISPAATTKTDSSGNGNMPSPVADTTEPSVDLLQSLTSDGTMKSSDNSPKSPDNAHSNPVNSCRDPNLKSFRFEELVDESASTAAVNSAERLPQSAPPHISLEPVIEPFCNPRAVPSTILVQDGCFDSRFSFKLNPVAAPVRPRRFGLTSIRNLLRRTVNIVW